MTGALWVVAGIGLAGLANGQVLERASLNDLQFHGNNHSGPAFISDDGRWVVFESQASNLVIVDNNGQPDIFVRDRLTKTIRRISVSSGGTESNGLSRRPVISANGRYVIFESLASNLVANDTNAKLDVFVHDLLSSVTTRVSLDAGGAQLASESYLPSISQDGQFAAFATTASLVSSDTNNADDVYLRDVVAGTIQRISLGASGQQPNSWCSQPMLSRDARFVLFYSFATNLVPGDSNGVADVFVRDRLLGVTERISLSSLGVQGSAPAFPLGISDNGRWVCFLSASVYHPGQDANGTLDIFVRDRQLQTTELISAAAGGAAGNSYSNTASISGDGNWVVFSGMASNLVSGDANGWEDIFLRDRVNSTTTRIVPLQPATESNLTSQRPALSSDARFLVFDSLATNWVAGDSNQSNDVFVLDRFPSSATLLCEPGSGGTTNCPCSNPPAGPGRGCDNSELTGGATIHALGSAYLSQDTLHFVTSGQRSSAYSILVQGTTALFPGVAYGQGVVCAGGQLLRMYAQAALAGSVSLPAAGDVSISSRASALGAPILAGQSRSYFVFYRDPLVPPACPTSGVFTFNATPALSVVWWP